MPSQESACFRECVNKIPNTTTFHAIVNRNKIAETFTRDKLETCNMMQSMHFNIT